MNNPNHPYSFLNISQNHSLIPNVFIIILLKVTIVTIEIISFIPSLVYGMLLTQLTSFVITTAIWLRLKKQLKKFLLNIQSYGNSNYWEPVNFSVINYISQTSR